jgi:hypothetical protein
LMNLDRTSKPRVASFRYQGVSISEVAYDSLFEGKWRNRETSKQKSFHRQSKKHTATYTATNGFFAEHDRTCLYKLVPP